MLSLIFRRGSGGCWEEKYWDAKGVWGAVFSPWQLRLLGFIIAWKSEPTLVYPDCSVLLTQLSWGHWINSMILLGMWVWDLEKLRERESWGWASCPCFRWGRSACVESEGWEDELSLTLQGDHILVFHGLLLGNLVGSCVFPASTWQPKSYSHLCHWEAQILKNAAFFVSSTPYRTLYQINIANRSSVQSDQWETKCSVNIVSTLQ